MFIPSTVIRLLHEIDITNDYSNSFTFASLATQSAFFISKTKYTFTDFTYQRKEGTCRVDGNLEQMYDVNYMMFKNSNFGDKWFYAFITDMKYINDDMTEITFELDVIQTWYFDVDMKNCYIEREHVTNDTIGLHLQDENLAIGEYVTRSKEFVDELGDTVIIIACATDINGDSDLAGPNIYGNIYSGVPYWVFFDAIDADNFIYQVGTVHGKTDAITTIFIMPKQMIPGINDLISGDSIQEEGVVTITKSFDKNHSDLDGYTPKNKKLFTYPYNYLHVSNHNNGYAILKYELCDESVMSFDIVSNICPNPTVYLIPNSYKGESWNYNEALTLTGFPLCTWVNDVFANWFAQNIVSSSLGVASSALALGVGFATANPIAIAGGAIGVAGSIGTFYEKSVLPNTIRGSISAGVNSAIGIQTFELCARTIRAEQAQIIDDYFTRFGYKVNELKTPVLKTRSNWNYLKMLEVNIFGNIPNSDLKKIHEVYKHGITFWHNDNVGNYNRTNPTI